MGYFFVSDSFNTSENSAICFWFNSISDESNLKLMELAFEILSYSLRLILNFEVIGSVAPPVNSSDIIRSLPDEAKVNLSLSAKNFSSENIILFSYLSGLGNIVKTITNSFGDSLRVSPGKAKPMNTSHLLKLTLLPMSQPPK